MEKSTTAVAEISDASQVGESRWRTDRRVLGYAVFVGVLSLVFLSPLIGLVRHALKEELHSHILLIPLVSLYLAGIQADSLPRKRWSSPLGAVLFALAAAAVYFGPQLAGVGGGWSHNDQLAQSTACYVLLLVAGGFSILGMPWMRLLAFSFAFLIFMIPLPDVLIEGLEAMLMRLSADLAGALFYLTGTPVHRAGQVIELPGMVLEVARECSGIRSTVVLFITSLLASYLFLKSSLHRGLLVALVIPLGILRNALRVLVIGLLCVHFGPEMIDSWIHHRGGPLFFGASLVPLFLMAALCRNREFKRAHAKNESDLALRDTYQ